MDSKISNEIVALRRFWRMRGHRIYSIYVCIRIHVQHKLLRSTANGADHVFWKVCRIFRNIGDQWVKRASWYDIRYKDADTATRDLAIFVCYSISMRLASFVFNETGVYYIGFSQVFRETNNRTPSESSVLNSSTIVVMGSLSNFVSISTGF